MACWATIPSLWTTLRSSTRTGRGKEGRSAAGCGSIPLIRELPFRKDLELAVNPQHPLRRHWAVLAFPSTLGSARGLFTGPERSLLALQEAGRERRMV